MYAEVAWVLVSSRTQVQPQIILDPDYLPDYLSRFYMLMCYNLFITPDKNDMKIEKNEIYRFSSVIKYKNVRI